MEGLCKYKNIIGEPRTGLHQYRLFDISVFDVGVTVFAGLLFSEIFKWNVWYTLGGLFLIGIIIHRMFCVRTTVDKVLFPDK